MRIKVGVIFGGESVEHEVSVISAIQAMNKIDEEKYEVIPIYITKDRCKNLRLRHTGIRDKIGKAKIFLM